MKRVINRATKKFDLIFGADFHLRDDIPVCRERDEYLAAQERKLKFIHDLCVEYDAILLIAGDVFDHWRPSPWLISLALRYIPPGTIVVPGQHDMVARNMQEMGKTGLWTLAEAGVAIILSGGLRRVLGDPTASYGAVYGYSYGEEAKNPPNGDRGLMILVWHKLACERDQPWPEAGAETISTMRRDLDGYGIVLTGDNHQQFYGKRFVNPGSMMRMASDQADFEPAVFGWSEDGTVTRIPLPIEKGVVKETKSNAKAKESRDQRMEAYIKKASTQFEDRLSFDKNLERHFKSNKERDGVEKITWKAVENESN